MNAKGGSNNGCRPSLALQGRHNKTQGSRPVLFYVAPSGANSKPFKTQFKPNSNPNSNQN